MPQLIDFTEASDSEKMLLLDNWLCGEMGDDSVSLEFFENLCELLSQCLTTEVDQDFNCFLSNNLLELLTKKLQSQ